MRKCAVCWIAIVLLPMLAKADDRAAVDFAKDVQPILQVRCVGCHGAEKQKGGLRLDQKAAAFKGGNGGPAIVPRDIKGSELLVKIGSDDPAERMPRSGDPLTAEQIGVLTRWIEAGADWPGEAGDTPARDPRAEHWAWRAVQRPLVPQTQNAAWPRGAIDRLVLARLEEQTLAPSAEADRLTLIRRLSFDLLGLPPTPEEVDAFFADRDPLAYEKLVDRYLESPRYGERWARHWLDVVRFADSHGFEMNQPRPNAWRYRDYVIRALNDDMPYDRFIREQIAGDAHGADEATGFLVGGPWDQVKSPDPGLTAQQRADELHDMVSTTGSAFLGLTVGCARCHDHKFDPITARDYYAMTACLAGVQHGERGVKPADWAAREKRASELRAELRTIETELRRFVPVAHPGHTLLIDEQTANAAENGPRVKELVPRQGIAQHKSGTARGEQNDPGDLNRLPNLGRSYTWYQTAAHQDAFAWIPGIAGRWRVWISWGCGPASHITDARYVLDLDGDLQTQNDQQELLRVDQRKFADGSDPDASALFWSGFADAGVRELRRESRIVLRGGDRAGPVTADVLMLQQPQPEETAGNQPALRSPVSRGMNVDRFAPTEAKFVRFRIAATTDAEPCLDELEVFAGGDEARNVALASAGTRAAASGTLPGFAIHQLEFVNDGRYGNDRSWISSQPRAGWVQLEFPQIELIDRVVWSRDRSETPRYADRVATGYTIEVSRDGTQWRTVASSADRLAVNNPQGITEVPTVAGLADVDAQSSGKLFARRVEIETALKSLSAMPMAYAGTFQTPGPTHRLHRGDPLQPREAVGPGGIAVFGGKLQLDAKASERDRRVALADWIAHRDNPLTARVLVNRLWQHHFGTGIVATPSDFGINGVRPSHPELLDWLAAEFIDSGWSMKALHRLIVTSSTYRQSGRMRPEAQARDAGNRWLWRYAPQRLDAEPLRDAILAISGNLSLEAGGPGFDLFEPNSNYVRVFVPKETFGPAEWRRMIYQTKPRMQLDGVFGAFDCPDAGQIAPRRIQSTTPLQALNLLNSGFALQQSDIFAERIKRDAGDDAAAQVRRTFRLAYQRLPDETELRESIALVRDHGLPTLCRVILNSNEFLYVF